MALFYCPIYGVHHIALVTALLAGTAIGQALGISFGESLYLSVVVLICIAWAVNRLMLRREHDVAEE